MATSRTVVPDVPAEKRDVKLRYIANYRVLLCTQCGYCVLHRALDRHLKAIHHLPAAKRKQHLAEVEDLDIADLEDVPYPEVGADPVPGLPIFDGYSCSFDGCHYLCVTNKRMQAHWRVEHASQTSLHCQRVRLQTFFRGNSLRYFIVARKGAGASPHTSDVSAQLDTRALTRAGVRAKGQLGRPDRARILSRRDTETTIQLPTANFANAEVPLTYDIRSPGTSVETAMEWLLTRQFCEDNYVSLKPVISAAPSWRDEVLQACSEADFLRFAILSLTANYIAFSYPDSREWYGREASRYRSLAITALGKRVVDLDAENFFAVFNFTRLITLCCLAGLQLNRLEGGASSNSILPEWFPIQHQGKALIWPHRGNGRLISAMHGPRRELAVSNALPEHDLSNNPFDIKLEELELALSALPDTVANPASMEALNLLRRVWATPYRDESNSFRDMALMWPTRISPAYLELIKAYDPVALVVLAHYWVLWSLSEEFYWYMKGHAETMLLRIVQTLDGEWQGWIGWPVSMIFGADLTAEQF